jgi:hypothetical protein
MVMVVMVPSLPLDLNTFDPRRDDVDVTVTVGSPGGFAISPSRLDRSAWRQAGRELATRQQADQLDHETVVSWSEAIRIERSCTKTYIYPPYLVCSAA